MRWSSGLPLVLCVAACASPVAHGDPESRGAGGSSGQRDPELHAGPSSGGAVRRPSDRDEEHADTVAYRSAEIEQLRITTPHTIEAGEVEVAFVPSYLDFGTSTESEFLTEIEYGVLDSLLLEVEVPFRWVDEDGEPFHGGFGDVAFGLKYQLPLLEPLELQSAIGAEVSLPTGDEKRGLGKGDPVGEVYVSLQRDFGRWSCVTDVFLVMQDDERTELEWNGAVAWRPGERPLFAMLGVNVGLESFESGDDPETSLVPGMEYKFDEFSFGLGVPIGVSHDAQDIGVILLFEFDL